MPRSRAGASVRQRSKVLFQHKLASPAPRPRRRSSRGRWPARPCSRSFPPSGRRSWRSGRPRIALRAPRAGLALALAAPVFPLGNHALGLALAYSVVALGWLALSWRDARAGLAFLAGPVLGVVGLVALVPLAVQLTRGHARRAAQAVAAVGVAGLAAGLRGAELPFAQGPVERVDLAGTESALEVASAIARAIPAELALGAAALAATAVAIPFARTPWRIAGLGAGALALTGIAAPTAPALPLVLAIWLTCVVLAWRAEH